MVPNGWTETYLGEVITHQKGFAFNSGSYRDKGIRIVRISDTTRNSIHSENPVYLAEEDANGLENYKLNKDDIILSTVGSRPHLLDSMVGKAVKVPLEADGSLLNQNLVKVIPKSSKINNEYLYEMLKNKRFIFFISTLVRGNANQVSITLSDLFQYHFALPPLPEQKKIAQILSTWDKAITTTEQLLANSQQQKKALMQQLLTGKKRLLDKNGVRFSREWKKVRLGTVADMNSGGTPKSNIEEYYGGNIPWVSIADMTKQGKWIASTEKYLTKLGLENSSARIYPKDSVLYAMYASIGECSIAQVPLSSSQAILGIRPKSELNFEFLYFFLNSLKEKIKLQGQQGTQSNLNKGMVKDFLLYLPGMEEQKKIAAVLSTADQEISTLQQKLEALKQEKKALMQQLLTGKRRVLVS